jgi:hypothetical protein
MATIGPLNNSFKEESFCTVEKRAIRMADSRVERCEMINSVQDLGDSLFGRVNDLIGLALRQA